MRFPLPPLVLATLAATPLAHAQAQTSLATTIIAQFPALRAGTTLGAWRTAHPADSVTRYRPDYDDNEHGPWCARARAWTPLNDGGTARTTTYFYHIRGSASEPLPRTDSDPSLIDQCRAGMAWISVYDTSVARTDQRREQTEISLSATIAAGDTVTKVTWQNAVKWLRPSIRSVDSVQLVVASAHQDVRTNIRTDDSTRVFGAITTPRSGVSLRWNDRIDTTGVHTAREYLSRAARPDSMMELSAIGGKVRADLQAFRKFFGSSPGSPRKLSDAQQIAFVAAMKQWLAAARTLPPARRAAALIVADVTMDESEFGAQWSDPDLPKLRQQFVAIGARFKWTELGGVFVYTRTWLKEAAAIAPGTRAGQLAFLMLAEMGFETSGQCADQGGEGFRAVIARSEARLKSTAKSAARRTITPELHLTIARAYGDIVRLAMGGGYGGDEDGFYSRKYGPELVHARTRAIGEYRVALATLPPGELRNAAWLEAWRMIAGIGPGRTWFYCVND